MVELDLLKLVVDATPSSSKDELFWKSDFLKQCLAVVKNVFIISASVTVVVLKSSL